VWYGTTVTKYREGYSVNSRMAVVGSIVAAAVILAAGCASRKAEPASASATPATGAQSSPARPASGSGATQTKNAAGYYEWTVQDLKQALASKNFVLVNVHIPFEGRIDGTDLEIPYDQIAKPENLAKLPADKNARIVLYCRSGNMSSVAVNELVKLGYTNLVDVKGGMRSWDAAGYPLDKAEAPLSKEKSKEMNDC